MLLAQHTRLALEAMGTLLAAVAVLATPSPAAAVDAFEIQVYDGTANAPGDPGIELHLNRVFSGVKSVPPPELPPHHQTHITLEPSLGITPSWELGAYIQTTLRGDGVFDASGVKLRSKFVTPPDWDPNFRLGLNIELSMLPRHYDAARFGTEVRPIAAFENERWLFAVNPILNMALAGSEVSDGPSFEPALMAKIKIADLFAVGIEYYASFGPIADPAPPSEQVHYLYEVVDLLAVPQLAVNLGIGQGLNDTSNAFVVKLIVGYGWEFGPASGTRSTPSGEGGEL